MICSFTEWLELLEASRRAMMTHEDPYVKTTALEPKPGDWVIYNPVKFFGAKAKRGLASTMYRIFNKLPGNKYALMHWTPAEGRKGKVIEADHEDITFDASFKFNSHDIPGASLQEKIWVRIPKSMPQLRSRFERMYQAYVAGDIEKMKRIDQEEADQDAATVGTKALLGKDDEDTQKKARRAVLDVADAKLRQNRAMQRRGEIKPQIDYDDDPYYAASVKPSSVEPSHRSVDDFEDRVHRLQPQPARAGDDFEQRVSSLHSRPEVDPDDKWDQVFTQYRQAQSRETNPHAAMSTPLPLTKAEGIVRFKGWKLIGENSRPSYRYF